MAQCLTAPRALPDNSRGLTVRTALELASHPSITGLALTPGAYGLGLAFAVLFVAASATGGVALCRVFLPGVRGALGGVAASILALSIFLALCQALGSVGRFDRWTLVVASVLAGGVATLVLARRARRPPTEPDHSGRELFPLETAIVAAALVVAFQPFLRLIGIVYRRGMVDWDTHWYHEPIAARFAQTGRLLDLHYVNNPPDSYLPFNAELVHAVGMLAVGRDHLSPLLNVGWAVLALVSAWCIGRPWKAGGPAVVAVALVLSTFVMTFVSAGSAGNDLPALALLLAAAAFVVHAPMTPGPVAIAGLAGGLAIGTKLTLVAPILALTGALAFVWIRARAWNLVLWWSGPLLFSGGFWYVRNAVRADNPFPWFEIGIGRFALPSSATSTRDCGDTTVAHYLTDADVLRGWFEPGLASAFGPLWAPLIVLSLAGAILALRGSVAERVLAVVTLVSAFAYLVTPATAGGLEEGVPSCFRLNTRFATPALALGLVLLAISSSKWRRLTPAVVSGGLALLVAANVSPSPVVLLAAGAVGAAAGFIVHLGRRVPMRIVVVGAVLVAASAAAAGWPIQAHYFENRYGEGLPEPIEASALRLRDTTDARIAVGGFYAHYALYDAELTNWVEFPVLPGPHGSFRRITNCQDWHEALARGRYDYVATYNSEANRMPPEAVWTRSFPGASRILSDGIHELFELDPRNRESVGGCPAR